MQEPEEAAGEAVAEDRHSDRILADAGASWRATQPEPRPVDPRLFRDDRRPRFELGWGSPARSFLTGAASATLVLIVAAVIFEPGLLARLVGGNPAATVDPATGYLPTGPASCPLTTPDPAFVPPPSYAGEPPGEWGHGWVGTKDLWTAVTLASDAWIGLPKSAAGYTQKTFWWSEDFRVSREQIPQIYVTGRRLDGPGAFGFGPGTNAGGSDIGSAMLVGVDVPTIGCWELTARYRGAALSIVVWVGA